MTRRLLIVDDELEIRETLGDFLRLEGYEVETSENGRTALASIQLSRPDLVVTDIRMPLKNGFELASELSSLQPPVPYLFISGFSGESEVHTFVGRPGYLGFVAKPLLIDKLLKLIHDHFRNTGAGVLPGT